MRMRSKLSEMKLSHNLGEKMKRLILIVLATLGLGMSLYAVAVASVWVVESRERSQEARIDPDAKNLLH